VPIIRDPLWNNIRVDEVAQSLLDTPAMQRLRYVRQLGLAHLVYPGATHSRFEHALGAHHLAKRALATLRDAGALEGVDAGEPGIVAAAALLHDIGHYPFSHALEEIGIAHHEEVARALILSGDVAGILESAYGKDAPKRILELIRGESWSPLQGLISGSLDLDKIDYLKRDAMMCGVPYGEIDEDRLIHAFTILADPTSGRRVTGVRQFWGHVKPAMRQKERAPELSPILSGFAANCDPSLNRNCELASVASRNWRCVCQTAKRNSHRPFSSACLPASPCRRCLMASHAQPTAV